MTTNKSRTDALTDEQLDAALAEFELAMETDPRNTDYARNSPTWPRVARAIRKDAIYAAILAASPVQQPAAATIPYEGLTEEFTDEVARLADDAPGIREAVSAALENCNAIIAPQGNAAPTPAAERAAYHFHRFVDGVEMAEDVLIERAPTLEAAIKEAVRCCEKRPMTVLVHAPTWAGTLCGGALANRAASANETDDYETRRKVAEALGIVWPGTRDGKRIGFAWSYLLGCIKDAAAKETGAERIGTVEIAGGRVRAFTFEQSDTPDGSYCLYTAPAQAAEPVAWAVYNGWSRICFYMTEEDARDHAQKAQKNHDLSGSLAAFRVVPLYAAPQPPAQPDAREGLTDEQILECATRRVPPREVPEIPELAFSRSQFVDVVRALLAAHPGQPEPIAWESTTVAYAKYITDERYQKFSPEVRKWYKPYRCSACSQPRAEVTGDDKVCAERYRWLRARMAFVEGPNAAASMSMRSSIPAPNHDFNADFVGDRFDASVDAAIDAAMAVARAQGGES
ncbi:hypothetical protein [Burkholderia multivorans]|uniref:hypothetical protein n=1 Tax=Burkholderia multivorans TaxID=87883 RepID=UPI0021C041A1|nr:hypothetical protein [Burkholderia multivorans]